MENSVEKHWGGVFDFTFMNRGNLLSIGVLVMRRGRHPNHKTEMAMGVEIPYHCIAK